MTMLPRIGSLVCKTFIRRFDSGPRLQVPLSRNPNKSRQLIDLDRFLVRLHRSVPFFAEASAVQPKQRILGEETPSFRNLPDGPRTVVRLFPEQNSQECHFCRCCCCGEGSTG